MDLLEQVKAVAQARAVSQKAKSDYDEAFNKWQEENRQLIEFRDRANEVQSEVEASLRESTILAYKETGNKQPALGVGIREMTKLEYDAKEALDWALEHKIALALDKRAFDKIAKTSPLEFVTISIEPQATIATDLDKILGENG